MNGMERTLESFVKAGVPVIIWGPPGVGKTSAVYALARKMGAKLAVVIASIREPVDFLGLPFPEENKKVFHYLAPDWADRVKTWTEEGHKVILLFDDLVTARTEVTNSLLRVILERVVGEVELGPTVYPIATANPPELIGGFPISPALANRFAHLRVEVDAQFIRDWTEEFPGYWGSEPALGINTDAWRMARAKVAAFVRAQPHLLYRYEEGAMAFPSPRSWDFVSRTLAVTDDADFRVVAALVGETAAIEFAAWYREANIPTPEELLENPQLILTLERSDQKYAALSAVTATVLGLQPREAVKFWGGLQSVINVLADSGDVDIAIPFAVKTAEYYFRRGMGILPGISLSERLIKPIREAGL